MFSERAYGGERTATIAGTAQKALMFLSVIIGTGYWAFAQTLPLVKTATEMVTKDGKEVPVTKLIDGGPLTGMMLGALLVGFVLAMITIFNPKISSFSGWIYSACQGVVLGTISAQYDKVFPGITITAMLSTLGVFLLMLVLYSLQIVRYTPKFAGGLLIAMGGVLIAYLGDMALRMFGASGIPGINDATPFGIFVSVVICGIAALSLVGDFSSIEEAQDRNAPKYMEWYGAFSLMVTLVWLYLEILRLLAKSKSND
jgi:uncharacterized YccA/Bax inhibitor family protein